MAKAIPSFDVWFVAANTVYKGVPFQVVAEWVQGGRLARADKTKPNGTELPWKSIADQDLFADYLPGPEPQPVPVETEPGESEPPATDLEFEPAEAPLRRARHDDDEDPDMIPLIDISLVLLIFFMMIRATGALSPVDVPDMQFAGELSKNADTLTVAIEKRSADDVVYSVRVGEQPPTKERSNLPNPEAAIRALDEVLAEAQRPPDVRIACAKDLPNERVYEIVRQLKSRKTKNQINSYDAEVNEQGSK